MTHPDQEPTPLGELAAELFLDRLRRLRLLTDSRQLLDYLPSDVGRALFDALIQLADRPVAVRVPTDHGDARQVEMLAIELTEDVPRPLDVMPYLVVPEDDPDARTTNRGTEAYASCLRDHFAADADRQRILVVITPAGNETQKSAQDSATDQQLLTLGDLLDLVLDRREVPRDAPLRAVARVVEAHRGDRERWERLVEDFQDYVDEVADAPPAVQGEKLPMLGCFLPDPNPGFASDDAADRIKILEDKDQRRRQRGEGRLYDNAVAHEFLTQLFADPITDPESALSDVLEDQPDKAREIAKGGAGGLRELELGTFAGVQRKRKRQKNQLDRSRLVVDGALAHRLLVQEGAESILVVTTAGPFRVTVGLTNPLVARRERAQLARWDHGRGKLDLKALPAADGTQEVTFEIDRPEAPFSVGRIALTRGVRTLRATIDHVLLAVYRADTAEIVVEQGRTVSLDEQAWIAAGGRQFVRYVGEEVETLRIEGELRVDGGDEDDTPITEVRLVGSPLRPRVSESAEVEPPDDNFSYEPLLELACTTIRRGQPTTRAMRSAAHYLDAVREIQPLDAGRYRVDLDGDTREVWADRGERDAATDPFRNGRAVFQLLTRPDAVRLELGGGAWTAREAREAMPASVERFVARRREALAKLLELAQERMPRLRADRVGGPVPVLLLPLHRAAGEITALVSAWNEAVDDTILDAFTPYKPWHDLLMQTDTLRIHGEDGALTRLVVLPTHPWLLGAAHAFQERFAENVRRAKEVPRNLAYPWAFELTRSDVHQMVPRGAVEDWYVWQPGQRLVLTDAAPFHLEFVPEDAHHHRTPLDYVGRIVANKIGRYLRMHPHLRDRKRTLRIGFVNPGDGQHLLEGLERWIRNTTEEHAGRILDVPMDQLPNVDVFLFSADDEPDAGSAFERFFRGERTDENVVRNALFARLQYRFRRASGPTSARDAVHLCFVHGLVDARRQQGKTAPIVAGWDGAFDDGLQATWLRQTLDGDARGNLRSQRGLWVDPEAEHPLRGALARILALQRGCRDHDLSREKGIYWETPLPTLRELASTYAHADWVVHLDRELSLEMFRRGASDDVPTIIEYSDQEVPESPGYDTITATRLAAPYREQLGEILTLADLDVAGREEAARTAANAILDDINVLSGSWALDFLMGSIADKQTSWRLKGNVGAALAYRWLQRMEGGRSRIPANVGDVVPVFVSLEDLLRVTPAAGLKQRDGLVHRYSNEVNPDDDAASWCDDLLVLYLTRPERGAPTRIYGRVIEVKFGTTAADRVTREKAVSQVKNTQALLATHLSGTSTRLDAPFRHKQLSLLIKAQLEQAVAMDVVGPEVYEFLDVPALSANLATGRYEVDYAIGVDGQHLAGDAFLLCTAASDDDQPIVDLVDGVRTILIPRRLVEWLAFELADSPTLVRRPVSTLPRLGHYTSAQTAYGPRGTVRAVPPEPPLELTTDEVSLPERVPVPGSTDDVAVLSPPQPPVAPIAGPRLAEATADPVKVAPYGDDEVVGAVRRLEQALRGHKVRLTSAPSARECDRGPRLLRVYVRLEPGESINAVRRISEDIARVVGTATSDIHVTNVPERHAVGLDLPIPGLTYAVSFDDLVGHPSFAAAQRDLQLGFCCGIDVTGRAVWADLAEMPHMLVAGTTGSGKTVFLRNVILTLLMHNGPDTLRLRLSSSKPMDFRVFTKAPHAADRPMAGDPAEATQLAGELIREMDRRYALIDEAMCDNLAEYNRENPGNPEPYIVAVFDEYSEMVASFGEKAERDAFEGAIGRLAQKARAAGIHLVVCMQRPDANALKGAIKANILHRFALKLPQNQDSRIILDEGGAETLLGQGDLLYKDANSRVARLQVPFLENAVLKTHLRRLIAGE